MLLFFDDFFDQREVFLELGFGVFYDGELFGFEKVLPG